MNDMTFVLNDLNWTVHMADQDHAALCSENRDEVIFGKTDFRTLEVYLDSSLDYVQFRRTVEHELTHVFAYSYAVRLELADEEQVADFNGTYVDGIYHLTERICRLYTERGAVNADP